MGTAIGDNQQHRQWKCFNTGLDLKISGERIYGIMKRSCLECQHHVYLVPRNRGYIYRTLIAILVASACKGPFCHRKMNVVFQVTVQMCSLGMSAYLQVHSN